MDIERLIELKQQVFDNFQLYEVKMQNSFDESMKEATPTDEMDEVGNDLTTLIDEAIARQSVKSEEVQEAIDALMLGGWQSYKDGYPITLGDKTIDIAITALQAYQKKPTSEEVQDAIEWTEEVLSNSEIWRDGDFGIPVAKSRKLETTRQLILSALQAYQPWVSVENRLPEEGAITHWPPMLLEPLKGEMI